ncbi:hypothetical protein VNO77_19272 [Canavalia gladiata]|uniref:Uncharacterized protein n=1 Tax=Canavalia gladiata TaxID=3824 RepID=A0AAN9LM44_CANGL
MERNVDRDDKSKNRQGIGHSETCIYGLSLTVLCLRFQNVSTKLRGKDDAKHAQTYSQRPHSVTLNDLPFCQLYFIARNTAQFH